MKHHLQYLRISIPEFINSCRAVDPRRAIIIMRKLCKASTIDSYDYDDGIRDFKNGDAIFLPKTEPERLMWQSMRQQQKDDFNNLVKIRETNINNGKNGGRPVKQNDSPKQSSSLPFPKIPTNTPDRKLAADSLLKQFTKQFDPNQDKAMTIYSDTNMAELRGEWGDFLRETFTKQTLNSLSDWLRKNWLNRQPKTETILKIGCAIQKLDFNKIWMSYINFMT